MTPDGLRLYAIGDVHGCRVHLSKLLREIARDAHQAGAERVRLVFLGDYIDRGPDSCGVVDDILNVRDEGLPDFGPVEVVCLKGNHEDFLLRFLFGSPVDVGSDWMMNGGAETLESYNISPPGLLSAGPGEIEAARDDLLKAMPRAHREFFEGLELMHRAGDYVFVHAGVWPGVPLEEQSAGDLLWIRGEFLETTEDLGGYVVHGHTPVRGVEERANRLDLDTGAVYGGDLTAACFWGTERRFLSVHS